MYNEANEGRRNKTYTYIYAIYIIHICIINSIIDIRVPSSYRLVIYIAICNNILLMIIQGSWSIIWHSLHVQLLHYTLYWMSTIFFLGYSLLIHTVYWYDIVKYDSAKHKVNINLHKILQSIDCVKQFSLDLIFEWFDDDLIILNYLFSYWPILNLMRNLETLKICSKMVPIWQ